MNLKSKLIPFIAVLFIFPQFFISDAYAYIDPGTGSAIIQMLIGSLVGLGIALKIYWHRIRMRFSNFSEKSGKE
tara:strand:+ start:133 stop:354 length:222 start_codon:yes stop_codon:yes gene_type:complete